MTILTILLQVAATTDSLQAVHITEAETSTSIGDVIDIAYKIAMVAIAVFNVFYVIRLNKIQNQDNEVQRKAERKMDWLKTTVLIPNLKKMYDFLDELWQQLEKLKLEGDESKNTEKENEVKAAIEPEIQKLFASFRSNFIIVLNATAPSLGKNVESICDVMRDNLLQNMADPGINIWVDSCFNDKIKVVYEKGKKDLIKNLFDYWEDDK